MKPVHLPPGKLCGRSSTHCDVSNIAFTVAAIAQLGERQTEDLKVPGSIPGLGIHISNASYANVHGFGAAWPSAEWELRCGQA
jgi:hypothetical protein